MNNLTELNKLISSNLIKIGFGSTLLLIILFSIPILTTQPRLWVDEAKDIELARGFLNTGKLDIEISPGKFSGVPEVLQSTGYPVTIPLAIFLKVFGYGLEQARTFMLFWMIVALGAVFFFARRLFGDREAIFAVLLIASFASFHDSGRTVVGEIPGFFFLILGMYFWLKKESYYLAGFLWGIAVVAKPSVFGLIVPAIFLVFALERQGFFVKIWKISAGMVPAALVWIWAVLDNPLMKSTWISMSEFYKNPYSSAISDNVIQNIKNIPHSSTLIYFGFLFLIVIFSRFLIEDKKIISLYNFVIIYCLLAFAYYLRSPGWLRYILIAELLILTILPYTVFEVVERLKSYFHRIGPYGGQLVAGALSILIVIQIIHFFTAADIYYSNSAIKVNEYIEREFPNKSAAFLDSIDVAVLNNRKNRFQTLGTSVIPELVMNNRFINIAPLSVDPLPELVIFSMDKILFQDEILVINKNYRLSRQLDGYNIYTLNTDL